MFRTILEPRLAYSSICLNAKLEIEDPAGRLVKVCPENSRPAEMDTVFYYGREYPDLPRHLFRPGISEDEAGQIGFDAVRENPIMLYWVDTLAPKYFFENGANLLFTLQLHDDARADLETSREFVFREKLNLHQYSHEHNDSQADEKFLGFYKIRKLERQMKKLETMLDRNGHVPRLWHEKKQEIIGELKHENCSFLRTLYLFFYFRHFNTKPVSTSIYSVHRNREKTIYYGSKATEQWIFSNDKCVW